MKSIRHTNGIRTSKNRKHLVRASTLIACLGAGALTAPASRAEVDVTHCNTVFDARASYPPLPTAGGADVVGEAGVVLFLLHDRGVVELDGCFHELDRPLQIAFAGLDTVNLLFELPDAEAGVPSLVHVSDGGVALETLDVMTTSFTYSMAPEEALGFEILEPGQPAPTQPVILTKPVDDDPEPE